MRAKKVDANQEQVVSALRAAGAVVHSLASVGNGMPDLLVAANGYTALVEVKDGRKPPSARVLTPDQIKFHAAWTGSTLAVVNDVEGALRVLATMKANPDKSVGM